MGKVKRLELWWQLYRTSLLVWDLKNFRLMDFCWHECTLCVCVFFFVFFILYNCSHITLKIINTTVIVGSVYHIHFPKHTISVTGSVATVRYKGCVEWGPFYRNSSSHWTNGDPSEQETLYLKKKTVPVAETLCLRSKYKDSGHIRCHVIMYCGQKRLYLWLLCLF